MYKINYLEEMKKLQNGIVSRIDLIQGRNLLCEKLRELGEVELVDEYCKLLQANMYKNIKLDNIKFKKEYECIWCG